VAKTQGASALCKKKKHRRFDRKKEESGGLENALFHISIQTLSDWGIGSQHCYIIWNRMNMNTTKKDKKKWLRCHK
jgi:hypothetical protein